MELQEGKKAPAFKLLDSDGQSVSLKDFHGQRVILYFYPKDMTPGCTTQACDFREQVAVLKRAKTVVIGISKDSIESHAKFRDKHDLNFVLLSDVDGKVCELYGVWRDKTLYGRTSKGIVRTTFVIDPAGKIEKIYNHVRATGHVERLLRELSS
jgi:peroxiredoxin Q/BCP